MKYIILFFLISCSSTPMGRTQLKLLPDSQMSALGDQSYAQLKQKIPKSNNKNLNKYVRCVTDALLIAQNKNPREWEVTVFEDNTANAFALPGNNIGVHTGILSLATDQAELAAVLGHEIAHVDSHHGNERLSQNLIIQGGLVVTQIALSQKRSKNDGLILAGLGLGAQFGILLPFSRSHETEADLLGMKYMALAGFNPDMAVILWQKMAKGGSSVPEFMSTHPSSQSRINYLTEEAKKYKQTFLNVSSKPNCHL